MNRAQTEEVWKTFWRNEQASAAPSVVSNQWNPLTRAQFDAWSTFAKRLTPKSTVIDIATGAGKVPAMLHTVRPDLRITGIDIAERLPTLSENVRLVGGVSMDDLPFDDGNFDVAISQFGFEYGDTQAAAAEIVRVLKPGGRIALMVHRGDGPILAQNRHRREQLRWVNDENELFARVHALLPADNCSAPEAINLAEKLARQGEERFGQRSVAWEVCEAARRTLVLGPTNKREILMDALGSIKRELLGEISRIDSLEDACAAADDRKILLAGFRKHHREPIATIAINLPGENPFADLITF